MSRVALPSVTHRHLRHLEIQNETGYRTRAIRTLVVRALRFYGMAVRGVVRIAYSPVGGHRGCAALGNSAARAGLNMALTLPRDPGEADSEQFARVIRHEVLHWREAGHADMGPDILYCQGPAPEWAAGVTLEHVVPKAADPTEARDRKLAHARSMLKCARTRAKRAETIVQKWARRVRAAERAVERALVVETAPVDVAAGGGKP